MICHYTFYVFHLYVCMCARTELSGRPLKSKFCDRRGIPVKGLSDQPLWSHVPLSGHCSWVLWQSRCSRDTATLRRTPPPPCRRTAPSRRAREGRSGGARTQLPTFFSKVHVLRHSATTGSGGSILGGGHLSHKSSGRQTNTESSGCSPRS